MRAPEIGYGVDDRFPLKVVCLFSGEGGGGKSTTTHITERIVSEAKALLQHTAWNIADIAYALGFEYATYFNNFFKKLTGTNPKALRMQETMPASQV